MAGPDGRGDWARKGRHLSCRTPRRARECGHAAIGICSGARAGRATQDSGHRLSLPHGNRQLGMGRPPMASARPAASRAGWTAAACQCGGCDRCAVCVAQPTTDRSGRHCSRFARSQIEGTLRSRPGRSLSGSWTSRTIWRLPSYWPRTCARCLPVAAPWRSWAFSGTRTQQRSSRRCCHSSISGLPRAHPAHEA